MPWLITPKTNVDRILRDGMKVPAEGQAPSRDISQNVFATMNDMINLSWGRELIPEGVTHALIYVPGPRPDGIFGPVPADVLGRDMDLITFNVDGFTPSPAHHAMDKAENPVADPESFAKTKVRMRAKDFGDLVGDAMFENSDDREMVLVYAGSFYIEELLERDADGNLPPVDYDNPQELETLGYGLTLYRDFHSTNDGLTLEQLEETLLEFVRSERGLDEWRQTPEDDSPTP